MGFIEKIETIINKIIMSILHAIGVGMKKVTPQFIFKLHDKFQFSQQRFKTWFKQLPNLILKWLLTKGNSFKSNLATIDFKGIVNQHTKMIIEKSGVSADSSVFKKVRALFLAPFYLASQWFNGLSTNQALLLMTFTGASLLAVIGIFSSGSRIALIEEAARRPASIEPEAIYDRPDYYKKETKHFDMSSLRLPVFFSDINQLKSVDIDYTATLSNRAAKMYLEKQEFQLRDHLIIQIEPIVPSFPLEEEGKDIIRKKIQQEIDQFLIKHGIEGKTVDVKITYVLAN
jgi:flagellar basal body-associated protein FliL